MVKCNVCKKRLFRYNPLKPNEPDIAYDLSSIANSKNEILVCYSCFKECYGKTTIT